VRILGFRPAGYTGDPISATAMVSATTADPEPANDQASASTPLGFNTADLAVAAIGATQLNGSRVTYQAAVTNHGPGMAGGVSLAANVHSDLIPSEVTAPCSDGFGCALGSIPAGDSITVYATYEVPASYSDPDPIAVTFSVTANQGDGDLGNNQSTVHTGITAAAGDLAVSKTGPASAVAGHSVSYTIVVTNNGRGTAGSVSIADPNPPGLGSPVVTGPCDGGFDCGIGDLAGGSALVLGVTFDIPSSYTDTGITNQVSVSGFAADAMRATTATRC
jgi:uncharacterized repeat protein (TIGR01451 family)